MAVCFQYLWPGSYKPRWCAPVPASRYSSGRPGCPSQVLAGGRWWRGDSTAPCTWQFRPADHGHSPRAGHVCSNIPLIHTLGHYGDILIASVGLVWTTIFFHLRSKQCLVLQNSRNEVSSKTGKCKFKQLFSLTVALCIFVKKTCAKPFSLLTNGLISLLCSILYRKGSIWALKFCCGKTMTGLELPGKASLLFRYMSFSQ